MSNNKKPFIAIYDEKELQRQMLHHKLEQMQFEVLYSTSKVPEMIQNFNIHPVDIILFNADCDIKKSEYMLALLRSHKKKLSIVYYYCNPDAAFAGMIKEKFDAEAYFCPGTWEGILTTLDKLIPDEPLLRDNGRLLHLAPDNPFYKIADNKLYIRILQLLREGKNIKQITVIMNLPETTITYYLKKMREETGCSSIVEMVMDAKDSGLI